MSSQPHPSNELEALDGLKDLLVEPKRRAVDELMQLLDKVHHDYKQICYELTDLVEKEGPKTQRLLQYVQQRQDQFVITRERLVELARAYLTLDPRRIAPYIREFIVQSYGYFDISAAVDAEEKGAQRYTSYAALGYLLRDLDANRIDAQEAIRRIRRIEANLDYQWKRVNMAYARAAAKLTDLSG